MGRAWRAWKVPCRSHRCMLPQGGKTALGSSAPNLTAQPPTLGPPCGLSRDGEPWWFAHSGPCVASLEGTVPQVRGCSRRGAKQRWAAAPPTSQPNPHARPALRLLWAGGNLVACAWRAVRGEPVRYRAADAGMLHQGAKPAQQHRSQPFGQTGWE